MKIKNKQIQADRKGLKESEIFTLQKYKEINNIFKKFPYKGKFTEELKKTKEECEDVFDDFIKMNEKDWDLLTLIRLFDRQTYEHSIGTYIIAKEKIENSLENGEKIKEEIISEVGNIEVFYRACIFHDIGKISIPKFILKNSLSDKEWASRLYKVIKKQKNKLCFVTKKNLRKHNIFYFSNKLAFAENPNEILAILRSKKIRPVQIIPLRYGISKKELKVLRKDYNLDDDISFSELMKAHEKESYNILFSLGYEKEAIIAGNHGSEDALDQKFISKAHYSLKIGARMSDIVDLIYMADIQDALGNNRYYHKSFTKLKIMAFLVSDVNRGVINKTIACLWVRDEFEKLKGDIKFRETIKKLEINKNKLSNKELDVIKDLKIVSAFLSDI